MTAQTAAGASISLSAAAAHAALGALEKQIADLYEEEALDGAPSWHGRRPTPAAPESRAHAELVDALRLRDEDGGDYWFALGSECEPRAKDISHAADLAGHLLSIWQAAGGPGVGEGFLPPGPSRELTQAIRLVVHIPARSARAVLSTAAAARGYRLTSMGEWDA